jgi:hypothetical protein
VVGVHPLRELAGTEKVANWTYKSILHVDWRCGLSIICSATLPSLPDRVPDHHRYMLKPLHAAQSLMLI